MWIRSEDLNKINKKISNDYENLSDILYLNYLIKNNYYYLINNNKLKFYYQVIENTDLNKIIDILWFFNKKIDIISGWNELSNEFKSKFNNLYYLIISFKQKIKNVPINTSFIYLKSNTLIY